VFTYHSKDRVSYFVHTLFGYERAHLDGSTLSGYSNPASSIATTYNDFTVALGGGVDVRVNPRFSIRAGQVEYYRTTLNLSSFYNTAFDTLEFDGLATHQRNIRVSSGVVVRF
jgi:hypothetical protein